jgi:DNA polymerase elongation subunit (family B)
MQKIDENVLVFDLSTEGLEPLKSRIIGITCKDNTGERIFAKRQERELLVEFWEHITNGNYTQIVGYNSDDFDLPFLIIRSLKYGVKMCQIIRNSIDLRKLVFYGNNNRR